MAKEGRMAAVPDMSQGDLIDGWHDLRRNTKAASAVVPCDVVCDQPEKWCQRTWIAANAGFGQLQNGLDLAA